MSTPRMVVTTLSPTGKAVFEADRTPQIDENPLATILKYWTVDTVPVQSVATNSGAIGEVLANENGVNFLQVDVKPGMTLPMHATPSIDFGVITVGEIVCVLDSGEEKVLKSGDVFVQKGTQHSWENRGEVVTKMVCVLIAARA